MKKLIAVCLCIVMLFSLSIISFAEDNTELKFNSNGKFKIAVIADPQDGHPYSSKVISFMNEMLDDQKPDLVIFLGDNVTKDADNIESFSELLTPVTSRSIPFTFVFGNHDDESSSYNKEELLEIYQSFDGCLAYDADPEMHGCATHNLPILSSDGTKTAFNLWLLDSGDYAGDGYDCVRENQVDWYKATSKKLEEENDGLVPSLAFQHIIPQEAVEAAFIESPVSFGNTVGFSFTNGKNYTILPNLGNINGILMEKSCPSSDNEGEWDAMTERGDVLAVFGGHDHTNDFKVTADGMDYVQVAGCTYNSYGKDYLRCAKIITLNENDTWNYDIESAYLFDYALKDGSAIEGNKAEYVFAKIMNVFLTKLMQFLNQVFAPFKTN